MELDDKLKKLISLHEGLNGVFVKGYQIKLDLNSGFLTAIKHFKDNKSIFDLLGMYKSNGFSELSAPGSFKPLVLAVNGARLVQVDYSIDKTSFQHDFWKSKGEEFASSMAAMYSNAIKGKDVQWIKVKVNYRLMEEPLFDKYLL